MEDTVTEARMDDGRTRSLHVLIVDDDRAFGTATARVLEDHGLVATSVSTPEEGLRALADRTQVPDCVLLDLSMPRFSGTDMLSMMRESGIDVPIIMMSGFGDVRSAVRSMKLGASEFLEKPLDEQSLLIAIGRTARNQGRPTAADTNRPKAFAHLTGREKQIFDLTVSGYTAKEIGRRLSLSHRTVENYRARIMEKCGVRRVTHLIQLAQRS
jgi:FixJ family two-component response regulator